MVNKRRIDQETRAKENISSASSATHNFSTAVKKRLPRSVI